MNKYYFNYNLKLILKNERLMLNNNKINKIHQN